LPSSLFCFYQFLFLSVLIRVHPWLLPGFAALADDFK
jgi:hypothetical protein